MFNLIFVITSMEGEELSQEQIPSRCGWVSLEYTKYTSHHKYYSALCQMEYAN